VPFVNNGKKSAFIGEEEKCIFEVNLIFSLDERSKFIKRNYPNRSSSIKQCFWERQSTHLAYFRRFKAL
jgi:hypothetical protein